MKNNHKTKLIKRSLLTLVVLSILLTHFFAPRLITEIRNPIVGLIKRNKNVSTELASNDKNITRKVITIPSYDDIKLSARLTYSSFEATKGTIILLHGIRSSKNTFLDLSTFLAENGFNSVALDSRAHGESGGQFCSFGVNDKKRH